ncbi:MAG: hypothetical protein Q7J71_00570, partial [Polaromonas sp.]|nr:hypothetical protein [Polaromonas sp.]
MRRFFPLRPLVLTLAAGLPLACLADNDGEVAELRRQIQALTQRVDTHQSSLRVLAARLQQLEAASPGQARMVRTADGAQPDASASREPASAEGSGAEKVVREAPASRSAEAVYREQSAMFDRKFTLETGVSYSHSNR